MLPPLLQQHRQIKSLQLYNMEDAMATLTMTTLTLLNTQGWRLEVLVCGGCMLLKRWEAGRQATSAVGVVVVVVLPYPHQPPAEAAVVSKCESRVVQPRSTSSSILSCQQRSSTSPNTTPSSPYICLELLATYYQYK